MRYGAGFVTLTDKLNLLVTVILITMEVLLFLFVFFLGASVGSFVNVLIDRLPIRQSIFLKRSHCAKCKKNLTPLELIPIISYLALRGKCKKCKSKIPTRIFLVEVTSGLLYSAVFLLYVLRSVDFINLVYLLLLFPVFIGIFFTDLDYGIIPDELVLLVSSIVFVYLAVYSPNLIINHSLSGVGLLLIFLLIFLTTSGRGMGFGDVKLSFALGLFLGFPMTLVSVYLAFLTGATVAIILVLWGKKKLKGDTIPFGPFLVASSIATYFFGDVMLRQAIKILGV